MHGNTCAALGVGAVLLVAPQAARAQLLSRYLPQSVPGYTSDPVQAVLQGGGPDTRGLGWQVGDFVIRPQLDESFGFDQNPLGLSDGKSSLKVESAASVAANSNWSRDSFGASVSVDDLRFPNLPIADQRTTTAFMGGRIDIGRDSLDLSAGHVDADLGPTDILTQGLVAPIPYSSNDFRGAYDWRTNRLTLTPAVDLTSYRFGSEGGVDDTTLDKNQETGGATARYDFSGGRTAILVFQETAAEFQHRAPGQPSPNYLDSTVFGGLDYAADAFLRYDVLAGYERRSFSSDALKVASQPILEASVTYLPDRITTIKAVAIRHLSDASYNVAENVVYDEASLRADRAVRRRFVVNARLDYARTDGNGSTLAHTQFTAGAGAVWLLSRNVHAALAYTFSHGSDGGGTTGMVQEEVLGSDYLYRPNAYSASAVTLTLHLQL